MKVTIEFDLSLESDQETFLYLSNRKMVMATLKDVQSIILRDNEMLRNEYIDYLEEAGILDMVFPPEFVKQEKV